MTLHDLYRIALHLPVGLIAGFAATIHGVLSVEIVAIFVLYELKQAREIHDQPYKDILGALLGLLIAAAILLVLEIV